MTYSLDRSTLIPLSTASKTLFDFIAFRGISGPNAVNGIITSKIFPNFSFNTLDSGISPHSGHQMTLGAEFAGLGGTVRSIRPIIQYKQFIPVQNRRNAVGYSVNASYISGFGGLVAPPFQRFYMGGENDIRGFDIRSISPVAFLPSSNVITLTNPDGTPVPKNPANPRQGNWTIPIPVDQIVFPGGDLSVWTNLEYRITIAGPVAIAPFVDSGIDAIVRPRSCRSRTAQYDQVISTHLVARRWMLDTTARAGILSIAWQTAFAEPAGIGLHQLAPALSTGLELQMFLPVINAPFRIYWAYNPLRLDEQANPPIPITRAMFPAGRPATTPITWR